MSPADIYSSITSRFVEALEKGVVPWQRQRLSDHNFISGKEYRGINSLILGLADRSTPSWLTFKQVGELGGKVNKGEKSMPVIFWKIVDKTDEHGQKVIGAHGKPIALPFVRWSNVFNLDQTSGVKSPKIAKNPENEQGLEKAERLVLQTRIPIITASGTPCYIPKADVVQMPPASSFKSMESYYKTLFHEITHATGHESRLNREGVSEPIKFGSERYGKEELIGELGASFLANDCGILGKVQFENSAGYLHNWIQHLKANPKLLVQASSKAQQAADWVHSANTRENETITAKAQDIAFDKMLAEYKSVEAGLRRSKPKSADIAD